MASNDMDLDGPAGTFVIRPDITSFSDDYRFLSNFYPSHITIGTTVWPCVENAYQALKCHKIEDQDKFRNVRPGQAKRLGSKVKLRPDWEEIKLEAMFLLVKMKFHQNPILMLRLKETGTAELIEGNQWGDTYWGVCNGKGENYLGRILMYIRANPHCSSNTMTADKIQSIRRLNHEMSD